MKPAKQRIGQKLFSASSKAIYTNQLSVAFFSADEFTLLKNTFRA